MHTRARLCSFDVSGVRMPRCASALLLTACLMAGRPSTAAAQDLVPLDEFSPAFLGMYRKVMLIEDDIRRYAEKYGVDYDLARAVCLYESGGNAGLTSVAGAKGYFQVMPATFRELRVATNIEGGIKYLSQMIRRFEREDRAVAAYNGGPGRIGRGGGLPLETLQYVLGVGQYRSVLKQYDASIRQHAGTIGLETVRAGDDWATLSARLGVPGWELRIHNPFLAERRLRQGQIVAYPSVPRENLFRVDGDHVEYRMRHGDNYIKLAFTLGLDLDGLRDVNGLWHIEATPAGTALRIPLAADRQQVLRAAVGLAPDVGAPEAVLVREAGGDDPATHIALAVATAPAREEPTPASTAAGESLLAAVVTHRVARGETLTDLAERYGTSAGAIQRENGMNGRTTIRVGEMLEIPGSDGGRVVTHRVASGETLSELADQYGTSTGAIQDASELGRRTTIRVGETLRIPAGSTAARTVVHRVASGDTLADLAHRYGTTIESIQSANELGNRTTIHVGDTLQIPSDRRPAPRPVTHRVSRGDTLAGLAEEYGISIRAIQDANDMGRRTTIRLGEVLRIHR